MRTGIALGSNLGDRLANLQAGRDAVLKLAGVDGQALSSRVYQTEPVDCGPEADAYLNAVIEIDYTGHPMLLLDDLQAIEAAFGRPSKHPRNAPRTLDLDILYVGNLTLANEEIVIPHARLQRRRFVLQPLNDIRPELVLPGYQRPIAELLAATHDSATVELFAAEW